MFLAAQTMRNALFPNHPYKWDRLGTESAVESLTADQLRQHHIRHLLGSNLVISFFGDISDEEAFALSSKAFKDVPSGKFITPQYDEAAPKLPVHLTQEQPFQQAIVMAGFPGVSIHDPRVDALEVLQNAMSGLSSDLSMAVRDERGLAYYVGAYQQPGLEPGLFAIYGGTRREAAAEVEMLYRKEIERLTAAGPREEEVTRAKRQIIADYEMDLQDNLNVALSCGLNELYGLGYDYIFSTPERFDAITAEMVRDAASSILNTNRMVESILLPQAE